jgi:15-cis-phytoene synthase
VSVAAGRTTAGSTLEEAYRECEQITWSQARNFSYGIRLLPPDKRRGLAAIYALARRIDDIGDGDLPAPEKLSRLEQARQQITASAGAEDPVLFALADVARRFPVPMPAFGEVIDGCIADVNGTTYETFDDLHQYCRCVAGAIGRLSLGIFGSDDDEQAPQLADDLGIALQLTNILRDIREDHGNGRIYLPAEDLNRFGCDLGQPAEPQFTKLMEFEIARARDWYAVGLRLLPLLDWRSAACTGAMAGIYRRLLEHIAADPTAVLRGRLSLPGRQKALVALTALTRRVR